MNMEETSNKNHIFVFVLLTTNSHFLKRIIMQKRRQQLLPKAYRHIIQEHFLLYLTNIMSAIFYYLDSILLRYEIRMEGVI